MYITPNARRKIIEVYVNLANLHGMVQEYEKLKTSVSDERLEEIICKIENRIGLNSDFVFAELVEVYNYNS